MKLPALAYAALGAILGALGQVCFKYGADGKTNFGDFFNAWIILGLTLYGVGTVLWILALSSVPLTAVYPFTALTYVLVGLFGTTLLGEQLSGKALSGTALVLLGLFLMAT